jgi:hypothetical protein
MVEADPNMLVAIKRNFTNSSLHFDELDGQTLISSPGLAASIDRGDAVGNALDLIRDLNIAIRVLEGRWPETNLVGVVRKDRNKVDRFMFAQPGTYAVQGVAAVAIAGNIGSPVRTKLERLVTLMKTNDAVRDIAATLATSPLTWAALNQAYETVTGLMSTKTNPKKARGDRACLVTKGWMTDAEGALFYHTAAYHRKGYPKSPIRGGGTQMDFEDAVKLVRRLFEHLVDDLQPCSRPSVLDALRDE